jgi:hypothetical protein
MSAMSTEPTLHLLTATGFSPEQARRYLELEERGRRDECLRMLRCRRPTFAAA